MVFKGAQSTGALPPPEKLKFATACSQGRFRFFIRKIHAITDFY